MNIKIFYVETRTSKNILVLDLPKGTYHMSCYQYIRNTLRPKVECALCKRMVEFIHNPSILDENTITDRALLNKLHYLLDNTCFNCLMAFHLNYKELFFKYDMGLL